MKYALFFCLAILPEWADARWGEARNGKDSQRYTIDINDYRGRTYAWRELNIKDLLRSEHSVRLRNAKLSRVEIDAAPEHGRVSLDLVIGHSVVDSGRFRWGDRDITLYNHNRIWGREWLLDIRGALHIRQIVIYLKQGHYGKKKKGAYRRGEHRRNKVIALGEQKIEKDILRLFQPIDNIVYTFDANGSWSHGIRIFCTKKKVMVNEVILQMRNGRRHRLYGLDRTYSKGESEEVFFLEKNVESVIIKATSPNPNGSRGILGVELYSS